MYTNGMRRTKEMSKPNYTDYVRGALRFYSKQLHPLYFKNAVYESNWNACHNVIQAYSDRDKDILVYVYGSGDTLADNVYVMSKKYQIDQNIIWEMMRDFECKVAIERGLWI